MRILLDIRDAGLALQVQQTLPLLWIIFDYHTQQASSYYIKVEYQKISFRLLLKVLIILSFLSSLVKIILSMYLLNNNRQLTEDTKCECPTQNSIFGSHVSKIKHCTIQEYYVIQIGNRLFSLCMTENKTKAEASHDMLLTKTYSNNTSLFAVIQCYSS